MKKKSQGILGELLMGFVVVLVCAAPLLAAVGHYRDLMMKSKYLPYSIQGYPQGDVLLAGRRRAGAGRGGHTGGGVRQRGACRAHRQRLPGVPLWGQEAAAGRGK